MNEGNISKNKFLSGNIPGLHHWAATLFRCLTAISLMSSKVFEGVSKITTWVSNKKNPEVR